MFILSHLVIDKFNLCENTVSASLISGFAIYAIVYIYTLFYNNNNLDVFNTFIVYIIAMDLLLSTTYHVITLNNKDADQNYSSIGDSDDSDVSSCSSETETEIEDAGMITNIDDANTNTNTNTDAELNPASDIMIEDVNMDSFTPVKLAVQDNVHYEMITKLEPIVEESVQDQDSIQAQDNTPIMILPPKPKRKYTRTATLSE